MEVILAVTKSCIHCSIIEKELNKRDIPYEIRYVEENPELSKRFQLKRSPNIDELVYRGMPEMLKLQSYLDELKQRIR